MDEEEFMFTWYEKDNRDLDRKELLDIIAFQNKEIKKVRENHEKSMEYLMMNIRRRGY